MGVGRTIDTGIAEARGTSIKDLSKTPEMFEEDVKKTGPDKGNKIPVAAFNASL
jgi:hypothetical protein